MLAVGTVVWLASELMFFSGLFAAWFALRSANSAWPPEGVELEPVRTGIATAVLLASSFTMHAGTRAAERGDRRGAARWVLATVAMGSVFVVNQGLEYAGFDFSLSSHAYGSIFYLMTGFHGLHVVGGLALMVAVLAVGTGRTRASLDEGLTVTEYYWHFVDVVWVAMFTTIYVLG
jgi:cytochrome c oxidase subunit 3